MKRLKETVYFEESIIETKEEYIPSSVRVYQNQTPVQVSEIGGRYINIDDDLPVGTELEIEYSVTSEYNKLGTNERLLKLESKVEEQQVVINKMLEALKYRVDIQTFTTYLKSLETQLGLELVDQVFSKPYPSGSVRL